MATIASKWKQEGKKEGKKEGRKEGKWDVVMKMLNKGVDIDFIAEITGFTTDQIKKFEQKVKAQQGNAAA